MSSPISIFELGKGADSPSELYTIVGYSLTMWESTEDLLLSIFKLLCSETEPTACETYLIAPRSSKNAMLKAAIRRYPRCVTETEARALERIMKDLDKLSTKRNEIAHGQVVEYNSSIGVDQMSSGHFLLPSMHDGMSKERSFKYAYKTSDLIGFVHDVRDKRSVLMGINSAIFPRVHSWMDGLSADEQDTVRIAQKMAKREMSVANFLKWVARTDFTSDNPADYD